MSARAFKAGWNARMAGVLESACPFDGQDSESREHRDAWSEGHLAAEDEFDCMDATEASHAMEDSLEHPLR